jgi:hypothetical protein
VKLNLNPMGRASRRERKFAKLGTRTPCCYKCGETSPECLILHHITSRQRDAELTVIICANCHKKEHAQLSDENIPMCREWSQPDLMKMRLLALAESQESTADALRKWAESLEQDRRNRAKGAIKARKRRSKHK